MMVKTEKVRSSGGISFQRRGAVTEGRGSVGELKLSILVMGCR